LDRAASWEWEIRDRTLVVRFAIPFRTLGWAPLGAGFSQVRAIVNHQVAEDDRVACEAPRAYLRTIVRELGLDPRVTAAMMTGAKVRRAACATVARGSLRAAAWCTAGCTNALRVGDRATFVQAAPGTINLIVALNQPMEPSAMAEAIQIATEARVLAVQQAGIMSKRSGQPATGTGTDCIVIAAPIGTPAHRYCGKHTLPGELMGRAVIKSCTTALARDQR
jgi:adenosylcobinamide amidohydrolase